MIAQRLRVAVPTSLLCIGLFAMLSACGDEGRIPRLVIPTRTAAPASPAADTGTGGSGGHGAAPVAATSSPATMRVPAPPPTRPPVPIQCSPPSPESASAPRGSTLAFSGACTFTESSRVACSTQPDDFIFQFSRDTPDGPTIYVQLNVEYYKGPGSYPQGVHVLFEIVDNGAIYEWDTVNGSATVDRGGRSGSLHNVSLAADPGTPSRGTITVDGSFACT